MSKQTYRVCFCFSRKFKLTAAEAPDEIKSLFDRYSDNGTMTVDHLHKFLIEVQGESDATLDDAESIVDQSAKHYYSLTNTKTHLFHRHKDGLSLEAFFRYLFAPANEPLSPSQKVVYQDMTSPLSHYFIYTGHNSYLTGNQLSSDCSDVPIIKALQKGVRVIELDMWPNSAKDDIDILHGRTLTSPVQLITCLRSIKKHAFDASEYPVILTLEDHLPPNLQAKVAQMVHETFGEMLFIPPGTETEFPSPESLKRRVIISTKPPKEYLSHTASIKKNSISKSKKDTFKADSNVKQTNDSEDVWGNEVQYMGNQGNEQDLEQEEEDDGDIDYDGLERITTGESEYKKLIGIHAKKRKGEFKEWFMWDPKAPPKRLSLSEQVLAKAIITHHSHILRFTEKNLLRVFPKTTRVDSSNYNPLIGWIHGAQMVAFNMQGYGRSLWLMHGMFKGNGGCGYVKKPDFLLGENHQQQLFNPKLTLPLKTTLKVKVYMGEGWYNDFRHTHFDAYSPPDFYARVGIAGVAADSVMKKTATIEDDWTPTWNQEFEFPLSVPELALLRIEVHEYDMSEKDDFAGQVCLPVSELRSGIRVVSLNDRKGEKYNSVKLLMHFTFV